VIAVTAACENIQDHERSWNQPIADYLQKAARELKPTRFSSLNDHSKDIRGTLNKSTFYGEPAQLWDAGARQIQRLS
jgi:hypothetical protein